MKQKLDLDQVIKALAKQAHQALVDHAEQVVDEAISNGQILKDERARYLTELTACSPIFVSGEERKESK